MTDPKQDSNEAILRKAPWTDVATSDDSSPTAPPAGEVGERTEDDEEPRVRPWGTVGPVIDEAGESEEVLKD